MTVKELVNIVNESGLDYLFVKYGIHESLEVEDNEEKINKLEEEIEYKNETVENLLDIIDDLTEGMGRFSKELYNLKGYE